MKSSHLSGLAILGVCLFVSATAYADETTTEKDDAQQAALFQTLDKNKDGKLAADEVDEDRAKFYKRLVRVGDTDKDGQLSKDEFLAATKPEKKPAPVVDEKEGDKKAKKNAKGNKGNQNPKRLFKRLNTNKDDVVTQDEINAADLPDKLKKRMGRLFKRLGKEEMTLADLENSLPKNRKADPAKKKEPAVDASKKGEKNPGQNFKKLDKDADGKLTLSEVPENFKPRLARMLKDAGKDEEGSINLNEFHRVSRQDGDEAKPPRRGPQAGDRPKGPPGRGRMDRPQGPPMLFIKLDTNKDGEVSKEELTQIFELFSELDKDTNGTLDPRELFGAPGRGPRDSERSPRRLGRGRNLEAGDSGRPDRPDRSARMEGRARGFGRPPFMGGLGKFEDGKISIDTALQNIKKRLEKLDANGDGFIDIEEFRSSRPEGMMGRRGPDDGDRPVRGPRRGRPEAEKGDRPDEKDGPRVGFRRRFIQRLDKDDDGKISAEEAVGPLKADFEKIDGDKDGYLDAEELRNLRPNRSSRRNRTSEKNAPDKKAPEKKAEEKKDESKDAPAEKPEGKDA